MRQYKCSVEVLPDVFCIRLPLPGRKPGPVNVYLFKGRKNTLIDTGMAQTAGILKKALAEHHLGFADIDTIIITHGHPEHFGAARKIVLAGRAIVMAHEGDRTFIEKGYGISAKQYKKFFRITGVPRNLEIILRLLFFFFKRMADPCRVDTIVREDDQIDIGRYRAKILETPGHSRGSVSIYLEQEQTLFCGDTVIKHITPNAFVVPDEDATLPVRLSQDEFFKSLMKIKSLSPRIVYSAHGKPIDDVDNIIAGYEKAFAERQENVLALIHAGEKNIYRIARRLFPNIGGWRLPLEIILSISEVYSAIQILQRKGKVCLRMRNNLLEVDQYRHP
ncbi:MAG TPA: MBL fold metallo-hydrolase [Smithella sp.]|nr:MBL fold metallo-hydrolase [Smithella sp.]